MARKKRERELRRKKRGRPEKKKKRGIMKEERERVQESNGFRNKREDIREKNTNSSSSIENLEHILGVVNFNRLPVGVLNSGVILFNEDPLNKLDSLLKEKSATLKKKKKKPSTTTKKGSLPNNKNKTTTTKKESLPQTKADFPTPPLPKTTIL